MEISVKLPNHLFQNISALARAKQKSVGEVITNAVKQAVVQGSADFSEQVKIIQQGIQFCSDNEILDLANLEMPEDDRLRYLFEKNRESVLTKKELAELAKAVELSQLNDIRKALGIVEAKKRGLR